jgi:hypothetical protein
MFSPMLTNVLAPGVNEGTFDTFDPKPARAG